MSDKIELKPCPFCGGKAKMVVYPNYNDGNDYVVICTKCDAGVPNWCETEEEATRQWNKRFDVTDKIELRSCPFCGGEAVIEHNSEYDDEGYAVRCSECGIESPNCCSDEHEAAQWWNRRAGNANKEGSV